MADRRRRRRNPRSPEAQTSTNPGQEVPEKKESLLSVVLWALAIAFVFKSFLLDTFWIPSGSMEPTLEVGDFIVVTKWAYGYNRHSLVFDPPIFKGERVLARDPQRGDVVVFDSTTVGQGGPYTELENGGYHVIKRVVGLPGDHVRLIEGLIEITTPEGQVLTFVREEVAREEVIEEIELSNGTSLAQPGIFVTYEETNPEGRRYAVREILTTAGAPTGPDTYRLDQAIPGFFPDDVVPEGHVFVMGDNRDRSADSRASLRSIPMHKIVGRARLVVFSLGENWLPVWNRFFRPIR